MQSHNRSYLRCSQYSRYSEYFLQLQSSAFVIRWPWRVPWSSARCRSGSGFWISN